MYLPEILKRKTSSRFHGEITKNPNLQSTTWVTALAALVTAKSTTSSRSSPVRVRFLAAVTTDPTSNGTAKNDSLGRPESAGSASG